MTTPPPNLEAMKREFEAAMELVANSETKLFSPESLDALLKVVDFKNVGALEAMIISMKPRLREKLSDDDAFDLFERSVRLLKLGAKTQTLLQLIAALNETKLDALPRPSLEASANEGLQRLLTEGDELASHISTILHLVNRP